MHNSIHIWMYELCCSWYYYTICSVAMICSVQSTLSFPTNALDLRFSWYSIFEFLQAYGYDCIPLLLQYIIFHSSSSHISWTGFNSCCAIGVLPCLTHYFFGIFTTEKRLFKNAIQSITSGQYFEKKGKISILQSKIISHRCPSKIPACIKNS